MPCLKELDLLGGGGTFKELDLVGGFEVVGGIPSKWTLESQSLLCFLAMSSAVARTVMHLPYCWCNSNGQMLINMKPPILRAKINLLPL